MQISIAESEQDIRNCFPVMKQLRTHLTENEFVTRVQRQTDEFGYKLAFVYENDQAKAVAGFRISECLYDGRYLYIDDLVTDETERSKGYGGQLFDWVINHAKENGCTKLTLDSGVQRFSAHRFYLSKRMEISCHHFSLDLEKI